MMKKTAFYILKCIIAGFISLAVLTMFSLVYYNPPIATPQPDLVTNYKFKENSKWSYMLEGYGYGKTDSLGYNNAYYTDNAPFDIVFVGSSYLEAIQVPEDCNFVYLLNQKFAEDNTADNNFRCFNLGISGHFFEVSASNFEHIAKKYKDAKYIVIEIAKEEYSSDELDAILNGEYHVPLQKGGYIRELAQKNPYFRLMYKKINELTPTDVSSDTSENETALLSDSEKLQVYNDKMNKILKRISALCAQNGVKPVILMHERFFPDALGNITLENNETYTNAFKDCCLNNNVEIIDVVPSMIKEYKKNYAFSYGYSNGVPGEGHLNKTGHKVIAQAVYKKINEMEEAK